MPRGSEKTLKGHRLLVWLLMTLCLIWYQVVGYSGSFTVQTDVMTALQPERFCFMAAQFFGAALCVGAGSFLERNQRALAPVISFSLLVGVLLFALSAHQTLLPQQLLASIGSTIMGICFAWVFISYMRLFKSNASLWEYAVLQVAAQATMVLCLDVLLRFASFATQAVFIVITTIVLVIMLQIVRRALGNGRVQPKDDSLHQAVIELKRSKSQQSQVVALISISIATVILRATGVGGIWGNVRSVGATREFWQTLLMVLVFALIASAIYYAFIRMRGWRQIHAPFLILIAAFLLIVALEPVLGDGVGGRWAMAFDCFKIAVELFSQTLYLLTIIMCMRTLPYSSGRVVGLALAIPSFLSLTWILLFERYTPAFSLLVLAGSYVLMLFVSISGRRSVKQVDDAAVEKREGIYADVISAAEIVAVEGELTTRETEVLTLLAQGRSLPYIQKQMNISESTVRTHVKHIYSKLGIHSRQELLDLLV
jgi:DNA-binding CsgD family transcriptional regulator